MIKSRNARKLASACAIAAIVALAGCGARPTENQSSDAPNAAAIATNAAQMSANQMHDQMTNQAGEHATMNDRMGNDPQGMGMGDGNMSDRPGMPGGRGMGMGMGGGSMADRPNMKHGNMPSPGGNNMAPQPAPAPMPMPMEKDDM